MRSETRRYRTGDRDVVLDLTGDCHDFVAGEQDGLLHLFVPHATAGLAVIETGAGSDDDLLAALEDMLSTDDRELRRGDLAFIARASHARVTVRHETHSTSLPIAGSIFAVGAGLLMSPAAADTTSVSGTRTCPAGRDLYVRVTTEREAKAVFYLAGRALYTSSSSTLHVHDYNRRGGSWRVTSTGNIETVRDSCVPSGATL